MSVEEYFELIAVLLARAWESQRKKIEEASAMIADSIAEGRILHFFAPGHSHMLGEELFYRAGGLAPVNVILEPALMVNYGAGKSSKMERLPGLAKIIFDESSASCGDVMIVASTSGVNQVPVEMACEAKAAGVKVIALTSVEYSRATPVRNDREMRLYDIGDIVIDTCVPYGDAAIAIEGVAQKVAPVSTVMGATIVNSIVVSVVENLAARGIEPPIFKSANVPGGLEHNARLLELYRPMIKSL
ncbi:MAG TPA: hypothetical protein DCQ13_00925 [Firmicutes bacterium]|nr:hypothetical protein [Bacillota bacterium]